MQHRCKYLKGINLGVEILAICTNFDFVSIEIRNFEPNLYFTALKLCEREFFN